MAAAPSTVQTLILVAAKRIGFTVREMRCRLKLFSHFLLARHEIHDGSLEGTSLYDGDPKLGRNGVHKPAAANQEVPTPPPFLDGLKKEEVKIEVDGQTLQISGGKFLRRLRLPENAKAEEVKAAMDNGVLTVTVLKQPEPKTKVLIQHLHEKLNLCEVLIQHLLEKLNLSEVLIQHLLKKLDLSEAKLKDSQYHLTAWQADPTCQSPYAPQSPFHPNSDHSNPTSNIHGLDIEEHDILRLAKLKDSQYHLTAWQADPAYQSPYAPQSPFHPNSDHSNPTSNTHGLDIVPQPAYAKGRMPASPPHSHNVGGDWDPSAGKYQHVGISSDLYHGAGHDHLRQPTYSHSSNETYEHQAHAVSPALAPNDLHSVLPSDEEPTMHVPMNDPFSDSEFEDAPGIRAMKEKDPTQRDGRSLHLPTLQEEPNSSNSEEDGPPPAIENLQIVGDAVPGSKLQACGFSINGTTLCVFQWVRHLQDETMVYIEGATQPHYTVTADDVDACIAIECVPMDDRHRKGELVKVFANNQSKIVCDPSMQEQIETYFLAGHAVFDVQLSVGTVDIWEPAVLTLKRSNYEIKGNRQRRVVVGEKYTSELSIVIPYGHQAQFVLTSSAGVSIRLSSSKDNLKMRDTIVLTMRLFKKQALEKRKGKKKFIFLPK